MQNRLVRYAILVLLSLVLVPVRVLGEAGWTSYANVTELTSTNQFYYRFTLRVAENPSGCSNKSVFYQDRSAFGAKEMFRILLEALSNGNKVRVYVTGNCELNGYSEISSVSIIP